MSQRDTDVSLRHSQLDAALLEPFGEPFQLPWRALVLLTNLSGGGGGSGSGGKGVGESAEITIGKGSGGKRGR